MIDSSSEAGRMRPQRVQRADVDRIASEGQTPRIVLVVDDHEANRELARLALERRGYIVVTGKSGTDCLTIARGVSPDLILLDLAMPGIDGYATARELKRSPTTQRIPIVAYTAQLLEEKETCALASNFDAYLAKPIEPAELDELLARIFAPVS